MTTLAAWFGVDSRGPTSFYIATESLVTWRAEKLLSWPAAQKVFACRTQPLVFGFCGIVDYVPLALSRVSELVDRHLLFSPEVSPEEKAEQLYEHLQRGLAQHPNQALQVFQIVCCIRSGENLSAKFSSWKFAFEKGVGWSKQPIEVPETSRVVADLTLGSGKRIFENWNYLWEKSQAGGTSRAVFSAFCEALQSAGDPLSGGPPQLVGLHRSGTPKQFGIIYQGRRYFCGVEFPTVNFDSDVEWFNATFERCSPETLNRLPSAQPQPRPSDIRWHGERSSNDKFGSDPR